MKIIQNTHILSMDPNVPDGKGTIYIDKNGTIKTVLYASGQVVGDPGFPSRGDGVFPNRASEGDTITIPGFVDTHRHLWETALRNIAPNHTLADYFRDILGKYAPKYTAQDVRISNELGALGAINAGVTQILDWSHIQNSWAHTAAAVTGLQNSGIRFTFAYGTPMDGSGWWDPNSRRRQSLEALRTIRNAVATGPLGKLALAPRGPDWSHPEVAAMEFNEARSEGFPISVHINGHKGHNAIDRLIGSGFALGPDVTLIHACHLSQDERAKVAKAGTHLSIAPEVEMLMGHGYPPFIDALLMDINVSLSVDVETTVPGDMFNQMRTAMLVANRDIWQSSGGTVRGIRAEDALRMATINGAKANGTADITGSITPGKQADLTILRADTVNVVPINDPYGAVLAMDTSNVDTVLVNGEVLKRFGKLVRNVSPLLASITESAAQIRSAADTEGIGR